MMERDKRYVLHPDTNRFLNAWDAIGAMAILYTATLTPEACSVQPGKGVDRADVVLKTTEKLFLRMVVDGKMPGALDIARGRIKTNDPGALKQLRDLFDFSP